MAASFPMSIALRQGPTARLLSIGLVLLFAATAQAAFPDLRGMTETVALLPHVGIDPAFDDSLSVVQDKFSGSGRLTSVTGRETENLDPGGRFFQAVDEALVRLKGVPTPELNLVIDSHGGYREICLPLGQPWSHFDFARGLDALLRARGVPNLTLNIFYNACHAGSMTHPFQFGSLRSSGVERVNVYTSSSASESSYGRQFFEVVDRLNKTITRAEAAGVYTLGGATPPRSEVFARSWPEVTNDFASREANRELPGWSSHIPASSRQDLRYAMPVYLFTDSQEEANRILERFMAQPEQALEEVSRVAAKIPAGSEAADRVQLLRFAGSNRQRVDTASLFRLALRGDQDQSQVGVRMLKELRAELFNPNRAKDLVRIIRDDPAKSGKLLEVVTREFFQDSLSVADMNSPAQNRFTQWQIGVRRDAPELPRLLESGADERQRHTASGLRWAMNGEDGDALRSFEKRFSMPAKAILVQDVALLQSASLSPAAVHGYLRRMKSSATFEEKARAVRMLRYLPHGFAGEGWYGPLNEELRREVLRWTDEALARNSEVELATRLRDSAWLKSARQPAMAPRVPPPKAQQGTEKSPPASGTCNRLFRWLKTQG